MNYNANDNIILVAPRPVRIASSAPYSQFHTPIAQRPHTRATVRFVSAPADAFDKLKLADDSGDDDRRTDSTWSSERDAPSPRSSPRYVYLPLRISSDSTGATIIPWVIRPVVQVSGTCIFDFAEHRIAPGPISPPKPWRNFFQFFAPLLYYSHPHPLCFVPPTVILHIIHTVAPHLAASVLRSLLRVLVCPLLIIMTTLSTNTRIFLILSNSLDQAI